MVLARQRLLIWLSGSVSADMEAVCFFVIKLHVDPISNLESTMAPLSPPLEREGGGEEEEERDTCFELV